MQKDAYSFDWPRFMWLAGLVALSVGLSLGLACAVPLAAFAALGALTMRRRAALLFILAVVAANQCVGFALLHYPLSAVVWVPAFALVGAFSVFAAEWAYRSTAFAHPFAGYAGVFLAAFAAYEGGFLAITVLASGDFAPYAGPVVLRVLAINAATFAGLLIAARLAAAVGLAGTGRRLHQRAA